MFTMDTESGFTDAVFVTSAYGLGEGVVQGAVNPDEFYVYKPALRAGRPAVLKRGVGDKATKMVYTDDATVGRTTEFVDVDPAERRLLSLTDDEVEELARHALVIEEHYGRPMDIEWGKDGVDGQIYVLQARPETVQSRVTGALERYKMPKESAAGAEVLVEGRAIGQKIGAGAVRVLTSVDQMSDFQRRRGAGRRHDRPRLGADHEARRGDRHQPRRPHLPRRDHRPRARHPRRGRHRLRRPATWPTAARSPSRAPRATPGSSTRGCSTSPSSAPSSTTMPEIPVKIMMNVGTPEQAFSFAQLPHRGVGLARLEFVINRQIGIHPRALLDLEADPAALPAPTCAPRSRRRSRPTPARASSSSSGSPRASRCWRPRSRRTR